MEEEDSEPEATMHDEPMPVEQQTEEANATNAEQPNDEEGRMPGQLPTAEQSTVKDYHSIKKSAKEKIAGLAGHEVTVGTRSSGTMTWKVVKLLYCCLYSSLNTVMSTVSLVVLIS